MAEKRIIDAFDIKSRFLRSAQLERDFDDSAALSGYVATDFVRSCLERIGEGLRPRSGQRAWRVTGDYGSGKSSFALFLAHALAGRDSTFPPQLRRLVDFDKLGVDRPRFLPVLATCSRQPLGISILQALRRSLCYTYRKGAKAKPAERIQRLLNTKGEPSDDEILAAIVDANAQVIADSKAQGLLIIVDELGKFLEFAAHQPQRQDVFLLQRLAETASRSAEEPLFVVCLLHQGFNAYSDQLNQSAQREWEKVAGRFEEIVFDQPVEQVAHLIASALNVRADEIPKAQATALRRAMEQALELGWFGPAQRQSLIDLAARLFPLHPTVLPVLIRCFRRFGQNERSLFSFLLSNEPFGLQAFCEQRLNDASPYSHVFVSGPSDAPECSDFVIVAEAVNSWQEVFSRARLRELVLSYAKDANPTPIRRANAGEDIWKEQVYRQPSDRIQIVHRRKADDEPSTGGDATGAGRTQGSQPTPLKPARMPTPPPPANGQAPTPAPQATPAGAWPWPQVGQLIAGYQGGSQDGAGDEEWMRQVEGRCKGALQQFQLQSKLLTKALTPNAALLKFQGSANLTVEQVLKRRSEFLTTHALNVISVRAEPGVVAIAIARPNRRVLHLPDVWKQWNPNCTHGNYDLLIAVREEDSSPLFLSPKTNAPHTLIAGSTGSGKSVLMQNIILGIACTNTTEQASIVLIDPKLGVDYFAFEGLPHLQGGIIDAQDNAILTLNELVVEMNRRYAVLKENKVSNIFDLNKKTNPTERLPFLWVIHDEFAEWMMTPEYADAVADVVGRLGVKARAAGISLVFAAQRPDANVMPMQLRANLGNRLVLRVDGEGTSEIALGEKGAERLLGKGHLAAKLEGETEIVFAQVPFVETDFLVQMVANLKGTH